MRHQKVYSDSGTGYFPQIYTVYESQSPKKVIKETLGKF